MKRKISDRVSVKFPNNLGLTTKTIVLQCLKYTADFHLNLAGKNPS